MDLLHTVHLGIMNTFAKTALWKLLAPEVWGLQEGNAGENVQLALMQLRNELWEWYRQWHRAHPHKQLTQVHDLLPSMLGTSNEPVLKTKGAETWGLVLFGVDALEAHAGQVGPSCDDLRDAGRCLVEFIEIVHNQKVNVPRRVQQDCCGKLIGWLLAPGS